MLSGSTLLAALDPPGRDMVEPCAQAVDFGSGEVLYEPGQIVEHAYFPRHAAIATFLVTLDAGGAVEAVLVGREGALGGLAGLGGVPAYTRVAVLSPGSFYRVGRDDLARAVERSPRLRELLARYAECLLAQSFQASACNAAHSIEQRAARWLCGVLERTGGDRLTMTQDQLARLLGVGRSYASRVLQKLKRDGLLTTRRGGLGVPDVARLAARGCCCSKPVSGHFDSVLYGRNVH